MRPYANALSLQDYARRLQRLRSLRDIFEEYASVNADDVGKRMTCGDFLRAMVRRKRGAGQRGKGGEREARVLVVNEMGELILL